MFRKFQFVALSSMAVVLTFIANANVSSFKAFVIYEPEIPESLK